MTIAYENEPDQSGAEAQPAGHDPRLDTPADETERQRFAAIQYIGALPHASRVIAIQSLYDQLPAEMRHDINTEAARLFPDNPKRQREYQLGQATMRRVTRHPNEETN